VEQVAGKKKGKGFCGEGNNLLSRNPQTQVDPGKGKGDCFISKKTRKSAREEKKNN